MIPKCYPGDRIFNPHLTTIKDSYIIDWAVVEEMVSGLGFTLVCVTLSRLVTVLVQPGVSCLELKDVTISSSVGEFQESLGILVCPAIQIIL